MLTGEDIIYLCRLHGRRVAILRTYRQAPPPPAPGANASPPTHLPAQESAVSAPLSSFPVRNSI